MTMPPNLTELAKQGDPKAIASLMNRSLQPKGITANASSRHGCLQLQLESTQVPNQAALVKFVQRGLTALGIESIRSVRVYGYQKGIETPAWEEEIDLPTPDLSHDALLDAIPSEESLEMPDVEGVESPPQPRKLNSRALILGSIALLLGLAALAYTLLKPKDSIPDTVTVPATPASPTATINSTASTPSPTPAATPFRDAVNKAMQASTATQTAATPEQWQEVSQQWQASIDLMAKVPEGDANYSIAQQKIGEYQRNLDYAKQQAGTP